MVSYRLTHEADRDLTEIYIFSIKTFGQKKAESYVERLLLALSALAAHPFRGRDFGRAKPGVRRLTYESHSIFFQPADAGIVVLRILHHRMDPTRHL